MKPWPTKILERYPLDPAVGHLQIKHVPTRPWWSHVGEERFFRGSSFGTDPWKLPGCIDLEWHPPRDPTRGYALVKYPKRGDESAQSVYYGTGLNPAGSEILFRLDTATDVIALLARIDSERPIAHPGFRVGQVWARDDGSARVIQAFDEDKPLVLAKGRQPIHGTAAASFDCVEVINLPPEFCYLVADPCCPWLAPWSTACLGKRHEDARVV